MGLPKSKSAGGIRRPPTALRGLPASGQNFLDANERTSGRRQHRISEKFDWPRLCRTQGGGVFRSTDNAETWTGINTGRTATNVRAVAVSPNGAGHIFAATFGGRAFRSTDNGDSWAQLNTGVPNATFLFLAINAGGYIFAGGDSLGGPVGVLRSTNNDGTWQPVNNGLTAGNGINPLIAG
jgi:photosystem II stability/assembly factor-like uncharacterized protein